MTPASRATWGLSTLRILLSGMLAASLYVPLVRAHDPSDVSAPSTPVAAARGRVVRVQLAPPSGQSFFVAKHGRWMKLCEGECTLELEPRRYQLALGTRAQTIDSYGMRVSIAQDAKLSAQVRSRRRARIAGGVLIGLAGALLLTPTIAGIVQRDPQMLLGALTLEAGIGLPFLIAPGIVLLKRDDLVEIRSEPVTMAQRMEPKPAWTGLRLRTQF